MWGNGANCYAYAANCKVPANGIYGAAIPGGYANQGVYPNPAVPYAAYADKLVLGVLLDAQKNNLKHAIASRVITTLPDAGSGFIIGLVANAAGFHFFRRDRVTRLWSWKDGIGADREKTITQLPGLAVTTMDDALFINAIQTNPAGFAPNWPNMTFVAYIGLGDIKGMTVAGISAATNVMA